MFNTSMITISIRRKKYIIVGLYFMKLQYAPFPLLKHLNVHVFKNMSLSLRMYYTSDICCKVGTNILFLPHVFPNVGLLWKS